MMHAANEVTTLASKAARGAGAPPAQAAMFGAATCAHLTAGRPTGTITDDLRCLPQGPILDIPVLFQKLIESTPEDEVTAEWALSDLLLSYLEAQPYLTKATRKNNRLQIHLSLRDPKQTTPITRVHLPAPLASELQRLAAKILVPDTAASRLSGAGAGLTDND